jgi:hypothetical protein
VARFLEGKPAQGVQLYRRFEELVTGMGEVLVAPAKTRIGFQNRRIFAAVNRIGENYLDIHIVTAAPIQSERVRRIEQLSPECSVNYLRVGHEEDLDGELREWLMGGYEWGNL